MKQKKHFIAHPSLVVTTAPIKTLQGGGNPLLIVLPENPTNNRTMDLTPWLDRGIDGWVHACAGQLRAFLQGGSVGVTTITCYWYSGLRHFFEYLVATKNHTDPTDFKSQDVRSFLSWMSEQGWSYSTQKTRYTNTKSVLAALVRRQIIPAQEDLFLANPFPGSKLHKKGQAPLSLTERMLVATALRNDLISIHKGQFDGADSTALVVHVLAVAIRCGANLTPLLEATRDCLQDHPFMPSMKRLMLFKRRGNSHKVVQLRYSKQADDSVSVAMDGVALIMKVLAYSKPLLDEAKPEHRKRLWLYRTESNGASAKVTPLTANVLSFGISAMIKRHNLRGDDGGPLLLNLSRLRKTVEMRLFDLSGGDLIATAALMGHDPKVADTHYLACTQAMRENATFVGEALPDIYRSGSDDRKVISILPEKTPAGRCKDPYEGDKAPKDGSPCDDFFSCFACSSYAITGSSDDLHRLFSFYVFLEREMHHAKTEAWSTEFRYTMLVIDRFTNDKFDAKAVEVARERASIAPISFWAAYTLSEVVHG